MTVSNMSLFLRSMADKSVAIVQNIMPTLVSLALPGRPETLVWAIDRSCGEWPTRLEARALTQFQAWAALVKQFPEASGVQFAPYDIDATFNGLQDFLAPARYWVRPSSYFEPHAPSHRHSIPFPGDPLPRPGNNDISDFQSTVLHELVHIAQNSRIGVQT